MADEVNNSLHPVLRVLCIAVQISWGLVQSTIGLFIFLVHAFRPHHIFRACVLTEWGMSAGVSLGLFVFVPEGASEGLIAHEYGHCLQSLVLGPLYLPLVLIPSLSWAGLPVLGRRRARKGISYYSLFTERNANFLAAYFCRLEPIGLEDLKTKRSKDMLAFRRRMRAREDSQREGGSNV